MNCEIDGWDNYLAAGNKDSATFWGDYDFTFKHYLHLKDKQWALVFENARHLYKNFLITLRILPHSTN